MNARQNGYELALQATRAGLCGIMEELIEYGFVSLDATNISGDPTTRKLEASYRMTTLPPHGENCNSPDFASLHIANHPVLSEVNATCAKIRRLERELMRTRAQLEKDVLALPAKVGPNTELGQELVNYLYWFNEDAPASAVRQIARALFPSKTSSAVLKKTYMTVPCDTCQNGTRQVELTTRSDVSLWRPSRLTCDECRAKQDEAYRKKRLLEQERRACRLNELRTMPYREYLQTPEWGERRKRAMKRAGYHCQVCNAYRVQLNAHHKTYERRGEELDSDLITLCHACHEIFHANGKLAGGQK